MAKAKIQTYQLKDFTITIDHSACISCGTCEALAPKTFKLDNKMMSQVNEKSADSAKTLAMAAEGCAVEAITIIDKKSGKKLWPRS